MILLLRSRFDLPTLGPRPDTVTPGTLRGSTASAGARQAVLLPPLRADLRAVVGARHGRDPRPRRPEVRVPELLLSADDSGRLLRRPTVRGDGGGARRRLRRLLEVCARSEEHTSELQSPDHLV